MTKPIKHPEENVVYKGPTPDIGDLSCYRAKPGLILSEWDLTIAERLAIMRGATIELGIYTEPIPPVSLSIVKRPGVDGESLEYVDPHGPYRAVEPGDLEAEMVLAAVDALGLTPPERSVVSGPIRKWSRTYLYGRSRANRWPLWTSWLLAPSKSARATVTTLRGLRKDGVDV